MLFPAETITLWEFVQTDHCGPGVSTPQVSWAMEVQSAVNPVQYLVTPRILAGLVMLPSLTMVANFTGILGSYLVGVLLLGVDSGIFLSKIETFVELRDIWGSLIKAAIFGVVLTHVGCYKGVFTENGAEGVGRATTEAVSFSAVFILFSDYIFTSFWQR